MGKGAKKGLFILSPGSPHKEPFTPTYFLERSFINEYI